MTPQQIEVHPEAFAEADAAVLWYAERSRHAAEEFLVELDNAIQSILEAPQRWPMFEEPFRRFPLIHFLILSSIGKQRRIGFKSWP